MDQEKWKAFYAEQIELYRKYGMGPGDIAKASAETIAGVLINTQCDIGASLARITTKIFQDAVAGRAMFTNINNN